MEVSPRQLELSNWVLVAALAAPHFLYAFIWFFPGHWRSTFKKNSVEVFAMAASLFKALQFSSLVNWYILRSPSGIDLTAINPVHAALALLLGVAGQTLNVAIFKAIGTAGVYYGFKLGHNIPWVTGFPFNTVQHPQYVGSVLTVWAFILLLWSQAPAGLGLIGVYWTLLYVVTGWKESKLH